MKRTARKPRRLAPFAALATLAAVLLLAACGGSSGGNATAPTATPIPTDTPAPTATTAPSGGGTTGAATITMALTSFSGNADVAIKAGQAVTFTSHGTHDLVIGSGGSFSAQSGAPAGLNSSAGVQFSPGDSKTITFSTPGTYQITCTIHPSMQASVTVTS